MGSHTMNQSLARACKRAVRSKIGSNIHKKGGEIADKKVVFVAFAIEDDRQRDFLKGQTEAKSFCYFQRRQL